VAGLNKQLDRLIDLQKRWHENKSDVWGVSTGFPSIDKLTGGLHEGEVFILGARTSHGKTALANQIAFSVAMKLALESADQGEVAGQVLMFSPEMSSNMLLLRQACVLSKVPSNKIRRGEASETEVAAWYEAIQLLRLLDPVITVSAGDALSAQQITTEVEAAQATGAPINLVVIDYLQYLTAGVTGGGGNAYNAASAVSKEIRVMANRLEVPVLLMAQLTRAASKRANSSEDPEDALPQVEDLRDSGKIEEHADTIALMYRPNVITEDQTKAQKAIIAVRKNRNGEVGVIDLFYYPHLTLFEDPMNNLKEVHI
jgi:replicative DNA helicase